MQVYHWWQRWFCWITVVVVGTTSTRYAAAFQASGRRPNPISTTTSTTTSQQQQSSTSSSWISPALLSLTSSKASTTQLHGFFADLFQPKKGIKVIVEEPPPKPKFDPVTIAPDFRVAALFLVAGAVLDVIPYIQLTLGPIVTLLGLLFLVQTFRIRFVFDDDNCLVLKIGDELKESGENIVLGGANRWDCDTIVNYDFFPKDWIDGPIGPILIYFKETQTDSSTWNQGPGQYANDPAKLAAGEAIPGQVHFFPAVCNGPQIRAEFEKRGCRKLPQ